MTDKVIVIWVSMEASGCQELNCGIRILNRRFWTWEKANENFDEISPYDSFVNENGPGATSKTLFFEFLKLN